MRKTKVKELRKIARRLYLEGRKIYGERVRPVNNILRQLKKAYNEGKIICP